MVKIIVESWIWWSLVILVAASRFISRRMTLGQFRKFQLDDYLMFLVLAFYTTLIVTINIVSHTSSNLLPPGFDVNSLSPADVRDRTYGSKIILVVEQCQCVTIWGAKACLIFMYLRLTSMRGEYIAVKLLGAFIAITFIVMEVLYFGVWCRPFHEYWAVPTDNIQCDAATNHLITNACFNLTSDCLMLAIGLPMFLRMNIPWKKKIPLILIFSLGIFVILAAVLNKVYSFTQPFGSEWTYWYIRESSTALLVANLPFVWNFWRRLCGIKSDSYNDSTHTASDSASTREGQTPSGQRQDLERGDSMFPGSTSSPIAAESKDMSFEEWLTDSSFTPVDKGGPITPFTHPALFYSNSPIRTTITTPTAASAVRATRSPIVRALTNDSAPRDTIRRDSSPDEKSYGRSPVSSVFPSLSSKRSADSFV